MNNEYLKKLTTSAVSEDDMLLLGWEEAGHNWQGWDLATILINLVINSSSFSNMEKIVHRSEQI